MYTDIFISNIEFIIIVELEVIIKKINVIHYYDNTIINIIHNISVNI